jgi:DNA-binding Xre family transcriptional regulator
MVNKGVAIVTVASQTGLNVSTISKLYHNYFERIDTNTIESLCRYFELKSLSDLLEIDPENARN